jgi:hypothetical protein
MKRTILTALLLLSACTKNESAAPGEPAPPEKTYPMTATIVSRDPRGNIVNLDNEDVPNVMSPMKMDYPLKGAKVDSLPPDGTAVNVTLHEQDGNYWVTDVKPAPARPPG